MHKFCWPSIFWDVTHYYHTYKVISLIQYSKSHPFIYLYPSFPTFCRIVMDVIGPLPKSQSGKHFVLVVCDYSVWILLWIGAHEEILTKKQIYVRMSQILAEVQYTNFSESEAAYIISRWTDWFKPDTENYTVEDCHCGGEGLVYIIPPCTSHLGSKVEVKTCTYIYMDFICKYLHVHM